MNIIKCWWSNPESSPTSYRRAIKFVFMKKIRHWLGKKKIIMEIDNLSSNTYNSDNDNIKVIFAVRLAMLYGSVGNILSNINASPKCCKWWKIFKEKEFDRNYSKTLQMRVWAKCVRISNVTPRNISQGNSTNRYMLIFIKTCTNWYV